MKLRVCVLGFSVGVGEIGRREAYELDKSLLNGPFWPKCLVCLFFYSQLDKKKMRKTN